MNSHSNSSPTKHGIKPDWPLLLRHYGNRPRYLDDDLFNVLAARGISGDGLLVTGYREDTEQLVLTVSFRQDAVKLIRDVNHVLEEILPFINPYSTKKGAGSEEIQFPVYIPSASITQSHYLVQTQDGKFRVELRNESGLTSTVIQGTLNECLYEIYRLCRDK